MKPTLTFIYAKGCGACDATLPDFKRLAMKLPQFQFNMLDADRPGLNLDFPVNYTPTLHFRVGKKRFVTDPPTMGRDFTAENMELWIRAAVQKWNALGRP